MKKNALPSILKYIFLVNVATRLWKLHHYASNAYTNR